MTQVILKVAYRPVRLAFCIKHGDKSAFRKAVSLSHVFWGGIYTPILAIGGSERPLEIAARYGIDAFYALSDDASVIEFAKENNKSAWPLLSEDLFIGCAKVPGLLDVSHVLFELNEQIPSEHPRVLPTWRDDDPLADVFACSFGVFPEADGEELNYGKMYETFLKPLRVEISSREPFPSILGRALTPRGVSSYRLHSDRRFNYFSDNALRERGVFFGNCDEFADMLAYWNLRASNVNVIFYDETRAADFICWRGWFEGRSVIWTSQDRSSDQSFLKELPSDAKLRSVSAIKPLVLGLSEQTVIATSDDNDEHTLHVMMPAFPHRAEVGDRSQYLATMVEGRFSYFDNNDHTLFAPGLSELSEYVGKNSVGFEWKSCRVHRYGTDYIKNAMSDVLILKPLKKNEVFKQTLQAFGIQAKESKPGLIANRLIKQMNGTPLCRIFKVSGVRDLIREFGAEKSFTRSAALAKIGPNLSSYDFHLPNKADESLTPQTVFDHLIDQGILRAGLEFECPNCNLSFWRLLDLVKTTIPCEFCGDEFNVTKQLEGKNCWKYRVSGLFSQHKDQQGAIPVAVTLNQIEGCLGIACESIISTAMELSSPQRTFDDCETDFLFLGRDIVGHNFLVLGECKGNTEIDLDSVNKLKAVADSIPVNRLQTYLLFSKLSPFTTQELGFFQTAQHADYRRVILLSNTELERSSIYDNVPSEKGVPRSPQSIDEWAAITDLLYYNASDHLEKLRDENGAFRKRVKTLNQPTQLLIVRDQ